VILATYNIHFGIGVDGRHDLDRVVANVRAADVLCLQEVGQGWRRNDLVDQAAAIAGALNYHFVYGAAFDVDASVADPAGRLVPRRRRFGNMVASRWPIRSTRTALLPKPPLGPRFDLHRCVVEAVVEAPGGALRVYSTHLSHVSQPRRLLQAARVLDLVRRAPAEGSAWDDTRADEDWTEGWATPVLPPAAIVAGDLNCLADSAEFAELTRASTDAAGADSDATLSDAWALAGHPRDTGITLVRPQPEGHRIDHVLVSGSLRARVRRAWIQRDESPASDHYPLLVELSG
jgi:endonuclease/exonuclease/phosphatase family metal-dependent hydrolase